MKRTRAERAAELLAMLERGPSFGPGHESPDEIKNLYRVWLSSWITPAVKALVPELRRP